MSDNNEVRFGAKDILIGTIETLTKGLLAILLYLVNSMDAKVDTIQSTSTKTNITVTEIKTQQNNNTSDITKNESRITDLWNEFYHTKNK